MSNRKLYSSNNLISLVVFLSFFVASCGPTISFQVKRPSQYSVENVEFVAIDQFTPIEGNIIFPEGKKGATSDSKSLLKPAVTGFESNLSSASQVADITRGLLVSKLSRNAPYLLINTTGGDNAYTGVQPDPSKTALLRAKVKYVDHQFKNSENLKYIVSIKNNNVPLEQKLMVAAGSAGAKALGGGFEQETAYVEQIAAMEVEFEIVRKSDDTPLIPSQTIRAYYVKKWGGDNGTSHLPEVIKEVIVDEYQQDEGFMSSLLSEKDKASLAINDPNTYLAKGYNLKQDSSVPLSALDLKIRLAEQITSKYLKMISPYEEKADLKLEGGDDVAITLIKGNAYEGAIARLEGLSNRGAPDNYNLGLAYEASGQFSIAIQRYEEALQQSPGNESYKNAIKRLKSR
ncbi:tetratricopeptide repeat protein [Deltaproteobacteria bacterium TL4]